VAAAWSTGTDPGAPSSPSRRRGRLLGILALAAVLAVALLFSPLIGNVAIPPEVVVRILVRQLSGGAVFANPCAGYTISPTLCQAYSEIVWQGRLPQVLLALGAGFAAGVVATQMQLL